MKIICPCCKETYEIPYTEQELEGATADCRHCKKMLIFKAGKPLDFHVYLHESDPSWPKNGEGCKYVEVTGELCPDCDSENIGKEQRMEPVEFLHKNGRCCVSVEVPVHFCRDCGYTWTRGDEAEHLRHNAVMAYRQENR